MLFTFVKFENEINYKAKHLKLILTNDNKTKGRDHGLAPYNQWRQLCGQPKVNQAKMMDALIILFRLSPGKCYPRFSPA